jgi:hypothetical protein
VNEYYSNQRERDLPEGESGLRAIKRIGAETRGASRKLDGYEWQEGSSYNGCDNGRVRELWAPLVVPE